MQRVHAQSACDKLPRSEWQVLIPDHHPGFIDWQTYEANQDPHRQEHPPGPHKVGRRREGRQRPAAEPCQLRALRTPLAHALSRAQFRTGVSLPRQDSWSRAAASIASTLAAFRSTEAVSRALIAALEPASSAATLAAASGSKQIARPRSSNGVSASSGQATKRAAPSAATVPSIQTTGWSLAAGARVGGELERHSKPLKPSLHAANCSVHGAPPKRSATVCSRSGPILPPSGTRQRPTPA